MGTHINTELHKEAIKISQEIGAKAASDLPERQFENTVQVDYLFYIIM